MTPLPLQRADALSSAAGTSNRGSGLSHIGCSPVGPRWAYAEAWALILIGMLTPLSGAGLYFVQLCGLPWDPRMATAARILQWLSATAILLWLPGLVIARTARKRTRLTALALGGISEALSIPHYAVLPYPRLGSVAFMAALVWLTVELLHRHGIDREAIGLSYPRTTVSRNQDWKIMGSVILYCWIGTTGAYVLIQLLPHLSQSMPVMHVTQQAALGWTSRWDVIPDELQSALGEDVVLVGAVTALLTAARRPTWEIYAIICTVEVSLHLYFGLPALAMLPYAWYRVRIFQRYGRLTPLLFGHYAFGVVGTALQVVPLFARVTAAACMAGGHELLRLYRRRRSTSVAQAAGGSDNTDLDA